MNSFTKNPTVSNLQKVVNDWISSEGGGYWPPLSMLAAILEELGEVSRELNFIENIKPPKNDQEIGDLGLELADLMISIVCLANYYKINLSEKLIEKIEKIKIRDKNRFKNFKQ
jgi:NTP pyrophosphatase (non-canonical NTP hydrolase)